MKDKNMKSREANPVHKLLPRGFGDGKLHPQGTGGSLGAKQQHL